MPTSIPFERSGCKRPGSVAKAVAGSDMIDSPTSAGNAMR